MDIDYIRDLVRNGHFSFSEHAKLRTLQRGIFSYDIVSTILGGVVIQEYPNYIPYPRVMFRSVRPITPAIDVICDLDEINHEVIIVTVEKARSRRGRGTQNRPERR